jgi:hypothetical protein
VQERRSITATQYVADSASAFERKGCAFERRTALLLWNRGVRSHAEACQVSAGTRAFWNRRKYVRLQELRSTALSAPDFPETQQKPKTGTKNANLKFFLNFFKIFIFFGFYLYKSMK